MFGSIAEGTTEVQHFLTGADCLATIRCFRSLGIEIEEKETSVIIHGKGLHGLAAPPEMLDTGNSGTTTRLLSGILAGQTFESVLSGDESLNRRPMKRIMDPLMQMGAKISHQPRRAPRHTLRISCGFRPGQILHPARRTLCRR